MSSVVLPRCLVSCVRAHICGPRPARRRCRRRARRRSGRRSRCRRTRRRRPGRRSRRRCRRRAPWASSSGPPELPGLTAASNWISPENLPCVGLGGAVQAGDDAGGGAVGQAERVADGDHVATRPRRRRRGSPARRPRAASPGSAWRCRRLGRRTATVAVVLVPSAKMMLTALPSAMTWLAVRMVPVSVTTTPVPERAVRGGDHHDRRDELLVDLGGSQRRSDALPLAAPLRCDRIADDVGSVEAV